jgi:hypothetical protein
MARNRGNDTEEATDVDLDIPEPEAAAEPTATEGETKAEEKAKSTKHDLPENWLTPTGLSKIVELKPQQVYGYVKNGKDFPSKIHTDGRTIVPVPAESAEGYGVPETDARAWILSRRTKTAEQKAAKAAADAAKAAAAPEGDASAPDVEGDASSVLDGVG